MRRHCIFGLIMCIAFASSAAADAPVYRGEPSSAYLKTWLLCGPFPNPEAAFDARGEDEPLGFYHDYLANIGGETGAIDFAAGVSFQGESREWKRFESQENAVSLDDAVSRSPEVLAYAYCEIESDKDAPCVLSIGSNDGVRAWLNGEEVLDLAVRRGLRLDENQIPVFLNEGRNTLLLKVGETDNLWGFSCRLLPFEDHFMKNTENYFQIRKRDDGSAALRFTGSAALAGTVIEKADLKIHPLRKPDTALASQTWSGESELPLRVASKAYAELVMNLDIALSGGAAVEAAIPFSVGNKVDYTLFSGGRTDYSIVIAEDASESERWAANELRHWLRQISDADFPVMEDTAPFNPKSILVGYGRHAVQALGGGVERPENGDESFFYKNAGPTIVICGGKQRGTMYGVMAFLENELGCRWYTPSVSVIPERDSYAFHYLDRAEAPGIRVRNDFYFEAFDPIWAARNRVNGAMGHREQPGGVECYWAVHTFFPLVPPEEFYEDHPEYFSLIGGKRVYERAQLCLTNPDVLRIVIERIRQRMRENPEYLIYSVSQNDWHGACRCDDCQAIAEREESEAGPVLWFVNQVADAVKDEFPGKYIGTLAYQYTRKPCKTIKPRDNVVIRLCSIECCFAHDFESCPENQSFVEDIEGWSAIAPRLYIWDYVVNFSHYVMPYPNFRVLKPNLQFFRDHNAIGIMEQAAYQSRGGEFAELRAYLIAKLLWNPEADTERIIDDFMYGYYGRAGHYVRAYFDLLHNQLTPETHIHLGLRPDDKLFSDEFVREAEAVFDMAETVADSEAIRRRVEMARLPVMYLKCKREPERAVADGTYRRFTEIAEREGVTHYAESGQPHREAFHRELQRYQ